MPLIVGQWGFHHMRAEHGLASALGEQLEQIGEAQNDVAPQLMGRFLRGICQFYFGEFVAARVILERCMCLADPAYRSIGGLSFDPYTQLLAYQALTLACLGYIDQARPRMDKALSEVRRLGHVHSLGLMLGQASRFDWLIRSALVRAEEMVALTTEHGFPLYSLGWGLAYRGRSLAALGQGQAALALLTQSLAQLRGIGTVMWTPILFVWLAEAHAMLGQLAEQQNCLAEAARIVETTDERVSEAEVLRVTGDLLNATGNLSGGEQYLRQAIAVAERQSAKLFQLRASTSLARLWRDQGRRANARDLLAPIYNWFTEGFDAPVLKEAKALLDELA